MPDKLLTAYLPFPHLTLHAHTSTHSLTYAASPWACALDHYEVSALRSTVG